MKPRDERPHQAPPTTRREFLKDVSALAAALPYAAYATHAVGATAHPTAQIENEFLAAACDPATGRLRCWLKDGAPLLTGSMVRASLTNGRRTTAEPAYGHTLEERPVQDRLGRGREILLRSADGRRQLDFETRVALYDGRPAVLVEVLCRNVSSEAIVIQSLEPVCAVSDTGGAVHWPGVTTVLTNGPMYYDPGRITELPAPTSEALRSWWNVGFFRGYDQPGLVCGYVENQTALGQISTTRQAEGGLPRTGLATVLPRVREQRARGGQAVLLPQAHLGQRRRSRLPQPPVPVASPGGRLPHRAHRRQRALGRPLARPRSGPPGDPEEGAPFLRRGGAGARPSPAFDRIR